MVRNNFAPTRLKMTDARQQIDQKNKTQGLKKALGFTAVLISALATLISPAFANILNTGTATGTYAGIDYDSNPAPASVPVSSPNRSLAVTKTAAPTANVKAGDTITYTYTVKNTGNVTLKDVSLSDVHNAFGAPPTPQSETLTTDAAPLGDSTDTPSNDGIWSILAPGDTVTFTATYIVQQSDVDNLQ